MGTRSYIRRLNNDVELNKYGASVIKLYCGTYKQRGLRRHK